jgi:V/A-type H+-transporting ATPase subunit D
VAKIKLTKNELKAQKDALAMYQRYLPTLQLKKAQLQQEIRGIELRVKELREQKRQIDESFKPWIGVFGENLVAKTGKEPIFGDNLVRITKLLRGTGNIAGVTIPTFQGAEFETAAYSLLNTPLWLDSAIESMKKALLVDLEAEVMEEQARLLEHELRVTTQRVNLFEKVKIPETKTNIKKINVYLGDQQTSAVVRGKISKRALAAKSLPSSSQKTETKEVA